MTTLLVADDEQTFLDFMVRLLQKDHHLLIARNWNEVLEKFESNLWRLNATILDVNMPGLSVDPYTMVEKILKSNPTVPMILISGQDIVLRHEFLKMGVFQYHAKPIDIMDLRLSIQSALDHNHTLRRLEGYDKYAHDEIRYFQKVLSLNMDDLRDKLASHDKEHKRSPIIIRANRGTRPEMLAKVIAQEIDGGLFFPKVCCNTLKNILPYNLQHGDTLYLEGIEHLANEEHAFLNKLLNEIGEGGKVNGNAYPNFRLIASITDQTHQNDSSEFAKLIAELSKVEFRIEPLRLRKHEMKDVITAVFEKRRKELFASAKSISEQLYEILIEYNWPLNFDELELVIEALVITCQDSVLLQKHLHQLDFSDIARSKYPSLDDMVDEHIKKVLRLTMGNKSRAAKMLGITPKTLYSRIRN